MNEFETDSDYATLRTAFGIRMTVRMGQKLYKFKSSFSKKAIRMAFIRKVLSVLMVKLAFTVGIIFLFIHNFMVLMLMIAMACCDNVRSTFPLNFICLFLFAFVESFFLGVAAYAYEAEEVMWIAGICAFICLGLTAFEFQTKYNFTMRRGFLFVALLCFVILGFLAIFLHDKIVQLVYACVSALIFSMFLVYDTKFLFGGHLKYSISPKGYIFVALNLCLDIIYLFIHIPQDAETKIQKCLNFDFYLSILIVFTIIGCLQIKVYK